MPEQRQIILQTVPPSPKALGARNENNIKSSFPSSPIHSGELSDEERKKLFQELVLDGVVLNGHGVNSYSRDFVGTSDNPVPDLNDVETGGGGLPASPYVPNLTSPGPGSVNASDQPAYSGELKDPEFNVEFGSGLGGLVSPSVTSANISKQGVLGAYISGRSYQGSDGKA